MDEIEMLLSAIIEETDHVSNNRAEIKHLIELVENEQVNICSDAVSMEEAHKPYNASRVSEQIDWEEL